VTIAWPDGCRAAASFTFDVDGESVWLAMDPANTHRPGVLSQGIYGPKVAVPLILELLAEHGVRASFFVPGMIVERHRPVIEGIVAAGHELGLHGYTHTRPALLSRDEERDELDRAYDLLTGLGASVSGYRSPAWDVSAHTLDLLEAKGILYASEFMDDFAPYRHDGRRLVELPISWLLDDWPHFQWHGGESQRTIRAAAEVEAIWLEEFDGIRRRGGSFILTMHPQVIGRPSRLDMLDRLLRHVRGCPDVWIATCAEIAAHADRALASQGA
jgi:peptidoglycan/xylan/chitin deacetylase (PgdA/CDA1 family)